MPVRDERGEDMSVEVKDKLVTVEGLGAIFGKDVSGNDIETTYVKKEGSVSGVKGDAENSFRTGNVNITPANIGAKATQTAVSDPTASGTSLTFIDSISQNTQGVITPTKKTVASATQSANGLMSSTDKTKLDGIEAGAQVNTVTGVKGAAESDYRDGNVSLDADDVGAISKDMNYTAATLPYANTEKIALLGTDGNNYYTTIGELASQIGGSGSGTTQAALVHYVKNCGSISGSGTTLNWTNPQIDNNITENMVVLKAELSNPAAQTSDWTCTTTNGYVTITGTIASGSSTNVLLYFGVSLSTAPSIIVNLASNSSDNVLKTNPTPGVMGTLGLANGGTGVSASTTAGLLDALGVTTLQTGTGTKGTNINTIGFQKLWKCGRICCFQAYLTISSDTTVAGTNEVIFTLPEGFRPNAEVQSFSSGKYAGAESTYLGIKIKTNGEIITAQGSGTITDHIAIYSITFFV